jgi:polyhydroxyalkanoate synthesis regulator protein
MDYVLRRYSNRRLYDPQQGRNVTLPEVAELVRAGRAVKVVENRTGADVTVSVLGQTFVGSLGSWSDRGATIGVLKTLIAEGGQSGMDILKKTVLASLGAVEVTRQKAEEIIDNLIQKGEVTKSKRSDAIVELLDKAQESTKSIRDKVTTEVTSTIENMKMAKKKDLDELESKVDQLIDAVKRIEEKLSN